MSYNKRTWANGDLITKERMNNIEDGIYDAHDEINAINNKVEENTTDTNTAKQDISDIKLQIGAEELTTNAKEVKGAINEVNSQIKDIAIHIEERKAIENDDTQRFQRAIDNAIEGQTILLKPCETLTISSTINCKPDVKINGNNATINYIGDDVLFNCDFSSYSGCKFENLKIVMTKNSTTQIGFKLRRFNNVGGFKNVTIVNGAYGINSVDSYMWTIDNVYIQNPKIAGIYHQGDNGCEFNWSDLTVEIGKDFEGKYGVEIERTTPDDTGGYYLNNCLVLVHKKLGGKLQQGWYVHSSSDSVATIVFNMVLGGADGFNEIDAENGNFAIKLENVSAVRLTNTWMMSVGFCGTDQVMISDSNVAYGMYF